MSFLEWLVLGIISESAFQLGGIDESQLEQLALRTHREIFAHFKESYR